MNELNLIEKKDVESTEEAEYMMKDEFSEDEKVKKKK